MTNAVIPVMNSGDSHLLSSVLVDTPIVDHCFWGRFPSSFDANQASLPLELILALPFLSRVDPLVGGIGKGIEGSLPVR